MTSHLSPCYSIVQSIRDGDGRRLTKLLGRRVGGKIPASVLSASLLEAASKGNEECVTSLLRAGADPDSVDEDGRTALYLLVELAGATPTIVQTLLTAGCNPNKVSRRQGVSWTTPALNFPPISVTFKCCHLANNKETHGLIM